jgi:outer membrane protein assembly factor BamB
MSIANRLLFLDVETGVFGPGTGVPGLLSTGPVVDGDLLLAGTAEYRLYALDRTTFDVRWVFTAGGAVSGPPVATADRVFVGCADGRLYALDRTTGALAWSRLLGEPDLLGFTASPVAADGDRIAVTSIQGEVALLDAASGRTVWEMRVADVVLASPVLTQTLVVVADVTGIVHGLDRATGRTVWTTGLEYPIYGDPVQVGRDTVFVTNGGLVSRLDTATGTIRWEQFLVGLDGLHAAAPAGDDLVVVTGNGDLVILLDGDSGFVRGFQRTAGMRPVSQPVAGPGLAVIQSGQVIEVLEWSR